MKKKLKEEDALKHLMWTRINQENYDRLCKLLSQSRYHSMSELLRKVICERQIIIYTKDESLDIVMGELTKIRKELKAIGINLNQITKQINSTSDKSKILQLGLESSEITLQLQGKLESIFKLIAQLGKKWLRE